VLDVNATVIDDRAARGEAAPSGTFLDCPENCFILGGGCPWENRQQGALATAHQRDGLGRKKLGRFRVLARVSKSGKAWSSSLE
jgi:hypothetical protein